MRPVIVMITDGSLTGGRNADGWFNRVAAAAHAGVDLIQVRERQLDDRELMAAVTRCLAAVHGTKVRVIVNDRLDIALACGAHGLHLRSDSFPAERARAVAPRGFLLGRSVHHVSDAAAAGDAVDYLMFGTVFETTSKPGREAAGPAALAAVVRSTAIPVLGVGGVTADHAGDVARAGAAGIAAIGLFTGDAMHVASDVQRVIDAFATGID